MSKINQIQSAILSADPGTYQKLMDTYIMKKYGLSNITPLGSHSGTNKTTKGTPDSFVRCEDGRFILIAHGTVGNQAFGKVESDILGCLDTSKTGINTEDIYQIICCHTSTNFTPGQVKKLCSYFCNTILIGLGDVSYDLCLKYPDLAHDHLNVDVDTHQIFDVKSFITYASQNPYSTTLDMPLLCREREISDVQILLEEKQIALILGSAGVGKTRFALEVAQKFAEQENFILKIVRANGESIYEDLKAEFPDNRNYFVLVDDADQLVQLKHLLDISIDSTREHMMKIILTVRDYAKEKLLQTVKSVSIPAIYELKPLQDDSISQVLSHNLNIKNTDLIQHIQLIAKGNIRLAIMAGVCALEGRFDALLNSFDIFNDYYSGVISSFERDEILVATLIAFFDSFELQETELPFGIALQQGINNVRFREICFNLHKKEVVSIFDGKAVKFENQNLRDYLLYYVFFKERWIKPSYLIYYAFPEYRQRVVFAFNTLLQLFNSTDNVAYIEMEVRVAWSQIKDSSYDTVLKFVEAFHKIIQDESLLFLKQKIDALPEFQENLYEYNFEKTSNYHIIRSDLIKILIGFKYTRRFKDAIQLALYYFERNTEYPMDIYFLFGEEWGIGHSSYKNKYAQELVLLEELLEYYKRHNTMPSAFCLLLAASYSLKLEFSSTESNKNDAIIFYQFGLLACEEVFALRSLSLRAFSILHEIPEFRKYVIEGLLNYPAFTLSDSDNKIVECDLNAFAESFKNLINVEDFETCKVLDHFEEICNRTKITYPVQLPHFYQNKIYNLYKSLKKDYFRRTENWKDAELKRKKNICKIAVNASDDDFSYLWEALKNEVVSGKTRDSWEISTGINILFSSFVKSSPSKFIKCCESYIEQQTPYWEGNSGIINGLIEVVGYNEAISFIRLREFNAKARWLVALYDHIPVNKINETIATEILYCLAGAIDGNNYTVSLQTVLRINSIYQEFFIKYVSAINAISEIKPHLMFEFLNPLEWDENLNADELIDYFGKDIDVLYTSYINAFRGSDHFDHKGNFLLKIIRRNKLFLPVFIHELQKMLNHGAHTYCLDILWNQDDYLELITIVMTALSLDPKCIFIYNILGENLLSYKHSNPSKCIRQDLWIEYYIVNNYGDRKAMEFVFGIVCNCSEKQLLNAIITFCKYNCSFEDFSSIYITPTHRAWCGSEVPVIEKEISFFEELRDSLDGFEFIEHRERISKYIQNHRERKERILLDEFLEGR